MYAQRALTVPSLACAPFLAGQPSQKGIPGSATRRKNEGRLGLIDDNRVSGTLEGEGGRGKSIPTRIEEIGPTSCTRRQEKNSRMDTSSRTKSVERPVRAVDLFIASLDALTLLEGSSTLSAQIDSDERATLLASFGQPVCRMSDERRGGRRNKGFRGRKRETSCREQTRRRKGIASTRESAKRSKRRREEGENELIGLPADSSNTLHSSNESIWNRKRL